MKRKQLMIFLAVAVVIFAGLYWYNDWSYRNFLPYPKLPPQYEGYRYIHEGAHGERYLARSLEEITGMPAADDITGPFYNATDHTIVLCVRTEERHGDGSNGDSREVYYKFNAAGDLIDSLVFVNTIQFLFQQYLLNDEGYCTWMLDGHKQWQPFQPINKGRTLDKPALIKAFRNLYARAQYVVFRDDDASTPDDLSENTLAFLNGQWTILYGQGRDDDSISIYQYPDKGSYKSAVLPAVQLMPVMNAPSEKAKGFYVTYFHREHFDNASGSIGSMGSPTGITGSPHWDGTGYIHLVYDGDTIRIKTDMQESLKPKEYQLGTEVQARFYTHPQWQFGLYSEGTSDMYIIRRIKP